MSSGDSIASAGARKKLMLARLAAARVAEHLAAGLLEFDAVHRVRLEVEHIAGYEGEHQSVQKHAVAAEHAPRRHGAERPEQLHHVIDEIVCHRQNPCVVKLRAGL